MQDINIIQILRTFFYIYFVCLVVFFLAVHLISKLITLNRIMKTLKTLQSKHFPWLIPFTYLTRKQMNMVSKRTFRDLNIQQIYESAQNLAGDTSSEDEGELTP